MIFLTLTRPYCLNPLSCGIKNFFGKTAVRVLRSYGVLMVYYLHAKNQENPCSGFTKKLVTTN